MLKHKEEDVTKNIRKQFKHSRVQLESSNWWWGSCDANCGLLGGGVLAMLIAGLPTLNAHLTLRRLKFVFI